MKIATLINCLILLLTTTALPAQVQRRRETPPSLNRPLPVCGRDAYPDLVVTGVEMRKSDDMIITVENRGPCNAKDNSLKVDWANTEDEVRAMSKKMPTDTHWLWVKVQAINRGETKQLKTFWAGSYGKWSESKMFLAFTVDYEKMIREEDEYNNTFILKP